MNLDVSKYTHYLDVAHQFDDYTCSQIMSEVWEVSNCVTAFNRLVAPISGAEVKKVSQLISDILSERGEQSTWGG